MNSIPVAFDMRMVADSQSPSPSLGKAALVVSDWVGHGNVLPHHQIAVHPASAIALQGAHSTSYVRDILACRLENGFGNRLPQVAAALPWQVGSLLAAAYQVLANRAEGVRRSRVPVACSPSSGFHHAGYKTARGFCTFNGLVVVAVALRRLGLVKRVAIIDCDYHYGDGTQNIIDTLKLDWLQHWSAGLEYTEPRQAKDFMLRLHHNVKRTIKDCDLALYQAGADQHIDDPLGGLLNTDEMARRDREVFRVCREYAVPVVWNLAGGYQTDLDGSIGPVLALHRLTLEQAVSVFVREEA